MKSKIIKNRLNKLFVDEAIIQMHTIHDIIRWAMSQFSSCGVYYGHGTDNPLDEAIQLILPSLFLPLNLPTDMYCSRLTSSEKMRVAQLVFRRVNERIPVPYLTNRSWFCGLEFYVDDQVFIPRSPIGELINDNFRDFLPHAPTHILDMCTGSGCIAIACAYAYLEAEVDAVDVALSALLVAEKNIQEHDLDQRVTPICSDLFQDLPLLSYDVIIANPPYVKQEDMNDLPEEFHAEPLLSLVAGNDGLDFVLRILASSPDYLSKEGILICEVGNSSVNLIEKYPEVPFHWIEFQCGGEGVFMLTRKQLVIFNDFFKSYRKK